MDFLDHLRDLSNRIQKQSASIQTEEATKTAFVMPFINALGYNVFDPMEVTPELVADVGTRKGEKVDYAILIDEKPMILFECKWCGTNLDKESPTQLLRYFTATRAKFGILTNGIIYRFYSDLEDQNVMDEKPFLELNLLDIKEPIVEEVKKFSKSSFDLESTLETASELKYMMEIKRVIEEQLNNPSEEYVRFFTSQVYSGRMTQQVKEQFTKLVKKTFNQFINDKINYTLNAAIKASATQEKQVPEEAVQKDQAIDTTKESKIETTEEELDGYYIIKTILRDTIDPTRISIRDTINYCGVLLDNTSHKPIARLYFNSPQKYLGIFDEQKQENKIPIDKIDDIYNYVDKLKATVQYYDTQKPPERTSKSLVSFTFKGQRYETKYWKEMLLKLSSIIAEAHKDRFDEILTLSGYKKPFFSRNAADLRAPSQIEGTDVFVEGNLSADSIIRICKNIITKFGYSESDFSIETQ